MRPLTWVFRLALAVTAGALLVTSVVVAIAPRMWQAANSHEELPIDLPDFEPLSQRSLVYDRNGDLIDIYELENSQPVDLEEVPEPVIAAFLAVEDNEFFQHDGVNLRSLIRATLSNFASDAAPQGASTVTMQVVKNEYLAGLDRDGRYKLLQIHYAKMLEKKLTKPEILERYLNTVFFGNNAYGIQAASETYFGKNVGDLTFIEAAFLAGLVRAPTTYDPINSPERSRERFVLVLDRLVDDGYLSRREANVLATDFVLPERPRSLPTEQTVRTYYTEALREYLLQRSDILGTTFEERYNRLYRGGVRIHTTFDPRLQLLAAGRATRYRRTMLGSTPPSSRSTPRPVPSAP
ncbi:MAG: transglycosylase domain-containing protein [Actinomycetota bacterium]|nr:transglycosylase domain-containing protein [Actinomycetota bacterium]